MNFEPIARNLLEFQWAAHLLCVILILVVRIGRIRDFFGLLLIATILLVVALGNAVNIELLLVDTTLQARTVAHLKALSLVSAVVYGSIGANLLAFAITNDPPAAHRS